MFPRRNVWYSQAVDGILNHAANKTGVGCSRRRLKVALFLSDAFRVSHWLKCGSSGARSAT